MAKKGLSEPDLGTTAYSTFLPSSLKYCTSVSGRLPPFSKLLYRWCIREMGHEASQLLMPGVFNIADRRPSFFEGRRFYLPEIWCCHNVATADFSHS